MPQISIVTGVSAGGGAYAPALNDFVVMTERARMFLTGPRVVREALGEQVSMEDLGGPAVQRRQRRLPAASPPDEHDGARIAASCSRYLPRVDRRPAATAALPLAAGDDPQRLRVPPRRAASTTCAR